MQLTTLTFLIFLLIVFSIYYIVPKKFQWIILLLSSTFFLFYKSFSLDIIIEVLIVLFGTYFSTRLIEKYPKKSKLFFLLGLFVILGQLVYLKYTNLFLDIFNFFIHIFNDNFSFEHVHRLSPAGTSYYSLVMIGYLIDVYNKKIPAQKNIFKCMLFMSYFPIVPSGPFIRYNDMSTKLYEGHKFEYKNFVYGFVKMLFGFFEILVISERLSKIVNFIYADYTLYTGPFILLGAICFVLQLYTNFKGSIDIIMGASEMLGIMLPENFKTPFFSRTIEEFWRRWHITLGAWIRDYVFYPLCLSNWNRKLGNFLEKHISKNVARKIPMYISLFIMWIVVGAWHGGAFTIIIGSGILQFIYILCEQLLGPVMKKVYAFLHIKTDVFSFRLYQRIRTFLLFAFALIFFRATSVENAFALIHSLFSIDVHTIKDAAGLFNPIDIPDVIVLLISLVALFVIEILKQSGDVRDKLFNQNLLFRYFIILLLLFSIIIFGCYGPGFDATTFIYNQF